MSSDNFVPLFAFFLLINDNFWLIVTRRLLYAKPLLFPNWFQLIYKNGTL